MVLILLDVLGDDLWVIVLGLMVVLVGSWV